MSSLLYPPTQKCSDAPAAAIIWLMILLAGELIVSTASLTSFCGLLWSILLGQCDHARPLYPPRRRCARARLPHFGPAPRGREYPRLCFVLCSVFLSFLRHPSTARPAPPMPPTGRPKTDGCGPFVCFCLCVLSAQHNVFDGKPFGKPVVSKFEKTRTS
jgi:hypothetical protein